MYLKEPQRDKYSTWKKCQITKSSLQFENWLLKIKIIHGLNWDQREFSLLGFPKQVPINMECIQIYSALLQDGQQTMIVREVLQVNGKIILIEGDCCIRPWLHELSEKKICPLNLKSDWDTSLCTSYIFAVVFSCVIAEICTAS